MMSWGAAVTKAKKGGIVPSLREACGKPRQTGCAYFFSVLPLFVSFRFGSYDSPMYSNTSLLACSRVRLMWLPDFYRLQS